MQEMRTIGAQKALKAHIQKLQREECSWISLLASIALALEFSVIPIVISDLFLPWKFSLIFRSKHSVAG